jgi:hypothetical protein
LTGDEGKQIAVLLKKNVGAILRRDIVERTTDSTLFVPFHSSTVLLYPSIPVPYLHNITVYRRGQEKYRGLHGGWDGVSSRVSSTLDYGSRRRRLSDEYISLSS